MIYLSLKLIYFGTRLNEWTIQNCSKKEYKKTSWYDNGQKEAEENRKDRKLDGKRTTWYKNGQIKSENNFKNGKKEGKSTIWHEDGQIKSVSNYKDGKLIVTE